MTVRKQINDLLQEVSKTREILGKLLEFYDAFIEGDFKQLGKSRLTAIGFSEIFDKYYTTLETLFLRISQVYGNSIQKERWHTDLLHKMIIGLPEVRKPVLQDRTAAVLQEFLKFRHFHRYYFEFEYDWDKLEYLNRKFLQIREWVETDLAAFEEFLRQVREAEPEQENSK